MQSAEWTKSGSSRWTPNSRFLDRSQRWWRRNAWQHPGTSCLMEWTAVTARHKPWPVCRYDKDGTYTPDHHQRAEMDLIMTCNGILRRSPCRGLQMLARRRVSISPWHGLIATHTEPL